jgi:hypothetical protein
LALSSADLEIQRIRYTYKGIEEFEEFQQPLRQYVNRPTMIANRV